MVDSNSFNSSEIEGASDSSVPETQNNQSAGMSTSQTSESAGQPLSEGGAPSYGAISSQEGEWMLNGERRSGIASEYMARQNATQQSTGEQTEKAGSSFGNGSTASSTPTSSGSQSDYPQNPDFSTGAPTSFPQTLGSDYPYPNGVTPNTLGSLGNLSGLNQPRPRKLPGRGWAITTLIGGIVLCLLIAPLVFFGTLVVKALGVAEHMETVSGQSTITVEDDFSEYTLVTVLSDKKEGWDCEVRKDGSKISPADDGDGYSNFQANSNDKSTVFSKVYQLTGKHKLEVSCTNSSDPGAKVSQIMVLRHVSAQIVLTPLIISSIVGLLGLVVTIVGIVWLVKRNRARHEILMGYV